MSEDNLEEKFKLPKLAEIEANPVGAKVPDDVHFQYVVASAMARNILNVVSIPSFCTYLARCHPDIARMGASDAISHHPELAGNPELEAMKIK